MTAFVENFKTVEGMTTFVENFKTVKLCLHIAFYTPFSAHLKMGSMHSYGAVYT